VEKRTVEPSSAIDDAALLLLLRAHEPAGLAHLYDRYGRLVFTMALRVVQDHGAAEEITQDVFLRCWNSIERYQPTQGSLVTWLLAITHHRAIDELRSRRGQHQRREISVEQFEHLGVRDSAIDQALLRDEIRASLDSLPLAQREAIELIFWSGYTRREAADRLGVPLGTLHTRIRLGMEKLRDGFSRLFGDE
jgi:RNA polymerase sigma-70 factor (ECF subfamily)